MGRLDGKVALITGGARGMGKSHVRHFVAQGAQVVFGDVLDDKGAALATEFDEKSCRYIHHDVTSEAGWAAAVALAADAFGRLDVLVNNAGALTFARIDRKSTRLNSSHPSISYAVFCLKKKKKHNISMWRLS